MSGDGVTLTLPNFHLGDGGSIPTSPLQMKVRPLSVSSGTALAFYDVHHYLHKQEYLAQYEFGAYFEGLLMGCISFGPISAMETLKTLGVRGDHPSRYFEIKRLAMKDSCPRNSESWFIRASIRILLKYVKPRAIITYADHGVGHRGTIYKASGFTYLGMTAPKNDFWVDGKIKQRGKTTGIKGQWKPRSRKHMFVLWIDYIKPN